MTLLLKILVIYAIGCLVALYFFIRFTMWDESVESWREIRNDELNAVFQLSFWSWVGVFMGCIVFIVEWVERNDPLRGLLAKLKIDKLFDRLF